MSVRETKGFLGLELTSEWWLQNHFRAKLPRRFQQLSNLPIGAGDRILDLCCGPGHYAEYYAQMVGTTGTVHAVDKDPALIDAAESRQRQLLLGDNIRYFCADVGQVQSIIGNERYDVILFFNCLSYFRDPKSTIHQYLALLRQGGRLILKDSDFGHLLISPLDAGLLHRVVEAAQESPPLSFDNFLGRRLPALAASLGMSSSRIEIWSYPMHSPLSSAEHFYVSENLMSLMRQGQKLLSTDDVRRWTTMFSPDSADALFLRTDFLFLMHEILTINVL
ncbi:MAG TPA: methyltransferase domain-containing protein [Chthoniobacterales bacterium]|nr:methyltransferase domain-containing protein [Chthoniobacterales bacterium]